jgi:ribosome recycling factor
MLKDLEGEGSLPADDRTRAEKKVEELTAEHVKRIDEMCSAKEQEILQV